MGLSVGRFGFRLSSSNTHAEALPTSLFLFRTLEHPMKIANEALTLSTRDAEDVSEDEETRQALPCAPGRWTGRSFVPWELLK